MGKEANRHHLEAEPLGWVQHPCFAGRTCVQSEHDRNARTVDIGVEQSDPKTLFGQGQGEIDCDRGLAKTGLTPRYRDEATDLLDAGKTHHPRRRSDGS
jgi:hypothetical protein